MTRSSMRAKHCCLLYFPMLYASFRLARTPVSLVSPDTPCSLVPLPKNAVFAPKKSVIGLVATFYLFISAF